MARGKRWAPAGVIQHVFNRGSRKGILFESRGQYILFLQLLAEARTLFRIRILAFCLMPNHWHLLVCPGGDDQELSRCMHWLTATHARRWRQITDTVGQGAVYQSRFGAVAMEDRWHLLVARRYIERNALVASLCPRAEEWPWSSATRRTDDDNQTFLVDQPPFPLPSKWSAILNGDVDWEASWEQDE